MGCGLITRVVHCTESRCKTVGSGTSGAWLPERFFFSTEAAFYLQSDRIWHWYLFSVVMKAVVAESNKVGETQTSICVEFSSAVLTLFAPLRFYHWRVYIAFPDAHLCFSLDYAALCVFYAFLKHA